MVTFLSIVHVTVCVFLAIVVLLQHGKGADVGATFGGSSQTIFGARGAATLLSKITIGAAITFMITSLSLAYLSSSGSSKSLMSQKGAQPSPVPTVSTSPSPAAPTPAVQPKK